MIVISRLLPSRYGQRRDKRLRELGEAPTPSPPTTLSAEMCDCDRSKVRTCVLVGGRLHLPECPIAQREWSKREVG
jgi:hypothetical protein